MKTIYPSILKFSGILKYFGIVLFLSAHSYLSAQIPDFQVNEIQGTAYRLGGSKPEVSIAILENGGCIITWTDIRDGYFDIYAQRFSEDGVAIGDNLKINDSVNYYNPQLAGPTGSPSVAANANGEFVVTWNRYLEQDDEDGISDIYTRCYSNDGIPLGSNFKVNNLIDDYRCNSHPSVALDNTGNFVITWGHENIYAQQYSRNGSPIGTSYRVNSMEENDWSYTTQAITMDPNGNFVIVWSTISEPPWIFEVLAQRYSSDGKALGNNFRINDDPGMTAIVSLSGPYPTNIASDSIGNFVIAWAAKYGDQHDSADIYIQRFSKDGFALGNNIKVNDHTGYSLFSSVAMDETGNIVVVWIEIDNKQDIWSIYAQLFTRDGNKFGDNYLVTDTSDGLLWAPDVALCNGKIYTTWLDGHVEADVYANIKEVDFPWVDVSNSEVFINSEFNLRNYPNPFNSSTMISYQLPEPGYAELSIYNIMGQKLTTLVKGMHNAGSYQVEWDASGFKGGIYFYQLHINNELTQTRKMIKLE